MRLLTRDEEIVRVGIIGDSTQLVALIFTLFLPLICLFCLFESWNVVRFDYLAIGWIDFDDLVPVPNVGIDVAISKLQLTNLFDVRLTVPYSDCALQSQCLTINQVNVRSAIRDVELVVAVRVDLVFISCHSTPLSDHAWECKLVNEVKACAV